MLCLCRHLCIHADTAHGYSFPCHSYPRSNAMCKVSGWSICLVGTGMHSETVMSILAAALQSEVWAACGALPE